MSWSVVAGAGGEEGVGLVGGSFSSFIASLWMGLDVWLFGGLILEGPPPWIVTLLFCLFVYVIVQPEIHVWCLPKLVVVGNCSLCINRHVRGHQPRSGRRCQIKSHLFLVYSQLVALHALARFDWLIASSNNVRNSLCASFARPSSPRMLLRTLTCAPRMQYTKASTDWFKRESPACVSPFTLSGTNQSNCLSATCPLMMNPSMFPLSFPVSLSSGKRWIEGFDNVTDGNIHFLNGQELPSS